MLSINNQHFEESKQYLEKAISEDSSYSQLYVILGYTLLRMNDLSNAKRVLQKGIEKDRTLFLAHDLMGVIFEQEGNIKGAIKEYKYALKVCPDFSHSSDAIRRLKKNK